jgi:hypothetical protein
MDSPMSSKRLPHVELNLVEWLEQVFPDSTPNITDSDREVWASVGVQRVIRKLRQVAQSQAGDGINILEHDDVEEVSFLDD